MPRFAPYQSTIDISKADMETRTKGDHRYDALRNLDNHSDSSTDVEDWDDDGGIHLKRTRRTLWKRIKSCRWMLDTALLLVIVGLLVERRWKAQKGHNYESAGDITGFAPSFSQQIVKFTPDPVFVPENASDFWSRETQKAWLDVVPEGLGYVQIKDAARYSNLPHPIHDYPNQTVYTTSMTHQLHCLYTILEAYNSLQISVELGFPNQVKMPWHINHCFEYIRQAVMCAGDVALEGAATTFPNDPITGEDLGGSDGWDAKHVCKDYSQVYAYLEKETINHVKWIASD